MTLPPTHVNVINKFKSIPKYSTISHFEGFYLNNEDLVVILEDESIPFTTKQFESISGLSWKEYKDICEWEEGYNK